MPNPHGGSVPANDVPAAFRVLYDMVGFTGDRIDVSLLFLYRALKP